MKKIVAMAMTLCLMLSWLWRKRNTFPEQPGLSGACPYHYG